ncbi:MAG: transglycosylase SLT domain-containing protein [Candidatus Hydrogenedentes bacterium]|nr:transglycosylase SLT domain-containing protein [Candidatus Hydrogenedentota bacterium]
MPRIFIICSLMVSLSAMARADSYPGGAPYVAARDAERGARYADAIAGFEQCAKADPELAEYARVRAAVCRARGGDAAGAIERLRAIADGPAEHAVSLFARAELAYLLYEQGGSAEAVRLLEPIVNTPISPKWLDPYERVYGDSLIASTNPESRTQGFALFARMLGEARTRSQRLEAANRLANSPAPRQRLDAADVFVNAGEWASGIKTLDALEAALGAGRAAHATEIDYLRARLKLAMAPDKDAGRTALLSVAKSHSDSASGRLALMYAARSYFTAGREPEPKPKKEPAEAVARRQSYRETATTLFDLMAGQLPNTKETGDALWWLARQHLDRDDEPAEIDAALAALQRLVAVCPNHERASDALYRVATILREKGDAQAAFAPLTRIIEQHPDSAYASAAAYGSAVILLAQEDRARAVSHFERAVALGGIGNFYAHRANQCLAEMDQARAGASTAIAAPGIGNYLRPIAVEGMQDAAQQLSDKWIERMRFFASHGYEEAEWEVLAHAPAVLESKRAGAYLAAISDAGLAATVDHIIERTKWGLKDDRPTAEALPALYPRAYWTAVQSTARETGSDPLLLLAIARQESLFQARVESHAGATGVMQLMPSTAAWIAKTETAIGPGHLENLDKPASSLRVGGYYYRYILGKNGGNTVYAIASYNAGPGNVSKWRAQFDAGHLDEFIEAIPFDETRDFVKKVLGNYAAYHSIYPARNRVAQGGYVEMAAGLAE